MIKRIMIQPPINGRRQIPERACESLRRLLFCFVKLFHRGGRDLPELEIALGAVVGSIFSDGQLAGIEGGNVGDIPTCSVLCHDDGCDIRPFA